MKYLFLVLLLSGCAEVSQVVKAGAQVNDEVRLSAEFTLCKAISVGSWLRAYGDSADKAAAWRTLCSEQGPQTPAKP